MDKERLSAICDSIIEEKRWRPFRDREVTITGAGVPLSACLTLHDRKIHLSCARDIERKMAALAGKHRLDGEPEMMVENMIYHLFVHEFNHHLYCPNSTFLFEEILDGLGRVIEKREIRSAKIRQICFDLHNMFADTVINAIECHDDASGRYRRGQDLSHLVVLHHHAESTFLGKKMDGAMLLFLASNLRLCGADPQMSHAFESYLPRLSSGMSQSVGDIVEVFLEGGALAQRIAAGELLADDPAAIVSRMCDYSRWGEKAEDYARIMMPYWKQEHQGLQNSFTGKGPQGGEAGEEQKSVERGRAASSPAATHGPGGQRGGAGRALTGGDEASANDASKQEGLPSPRAASSADDRRGERTQSHPEKEIEPRREQPGADEQTERPSGGPGEGADTPGIPGGFEPGNSEAQGNDGGTSGAALPETQDEANRGQRTTASRCGNTVADGKDARDASASLHSEERSLDGPFVIVVAESDGGGVPSSAGGTQATAGENGGGGGSGRGMSRGSGERAAGVDFEALDRLYEERAGLLDIDADARGAQALTIWRGTEEKDLSSLSEAHLPSTVFIDRPDGRAHISLKGRRYPIEIDPRSGESLGGLPDLCFVFDSSGSMGFNPVQGRGEYHTAILTFYSILRSLEQHGIAPLLRFNAINFSNATIASDWCHYRDLDRVKRTLLAHQGGGTTIDVRCVSSVRTSRTDHYLLFLLSDLQITNFPALEKELIASHESRSATVAVFKLGGANLITRRLEEAGITVLYPEAAEDFMCSSIKITQAVYAGAR